MKQQVYGVTRVMPQWRNHLQISSGDYREQGCAMLTEDGKELRVLNKAASISFLCPMCEALNHQHIMFAVPLEEWDGSQQSSDEDFTFECQTCRAKLHARIQTTPKVWAITFDDYPNHQIGIQELLFPEVDDDDWDDSDPPLTTRGELEGSIESIKQIIEKLPQEPWLAHGILKMAFSQTISIMEAFLSDTLISAVLQSPDALQRLVTTDRALLSQKLQLSDVLSDPNIVKTRVRKHLREIVYHKLERVAPLYRAIQVQIMRDKDRTDRILKAVANRHDIVHRNGKTHDGTFVFIERKHIDVLMLDIMDLANDIEVQRFEVARKEAEAQLRQSEGRTDELGNY